MIRKAHDPPTPAVPLLENIPEELKALPQWVVRKGKTPYQPGTKFGAKAGVPETWTSLTGALEALQTGLYDGLGFEFHDNGIVGINLDHVLNPETGEVAEWALQIVLDLDSYTEISPSGTGLHIFVRGNIPKKGRKKVLDKGNGQAIEMYKAQRYFTVTGNVFHSPGRVTEQAEKVNALYDRYFHEETPQVSRPEPLHSGKDYLSVGIEKDEKLHLLWNGGRPNGNESADDQALMNKLAYWCNCDVERMLQAFLSSPHARQKDEAHWKKSTERKDYLRRTAAKAVQDCKKTAECAELDYLDQRRRQAIADFAGGPENEALAQAAPQTVDDLKKYSLDDVGAARLFADVYRGRVLYIPEYKSYMVYEGGVWRQGGKDDLPARNLAKKLSDYVETLIPPPQPVAGELRDAVNEPLEDPWAPHRKHYHKYRTMKYRETQLKDARDELYDSASNFDKQPYLFNVKNGTLDLRTVKLSPHQPGDKLSKMANVVYDPNAHCERWETFIDEITEGNKERAYMLQKALGYALQGEANEECYFTAIGEKTRNGKGTLFDTVMNIFGGYGLQIDFNTLARSGARDGSRPTPDIARLIGVRLALANEPEQGVHLNEALMKQLTGNDDIVGRPLYGDIVQYKPMFKLFVTANSKPAISDNSLFSSGRVKLLPFTHFFSEEERDTGLKARFRKEDAKSGIFNWLLKGYSLYLEDGLSDTAEMKQLTEEYRLENDYIQQYLDECVDLDAKGTITVKQLRVDYARWCVDMGAKPLGVKLFKEELRKHGAVITRAKGQWTAHGQFRSQIV